MVVGEDQPEFPFRRIREERSRIIASSPGLGLRGFSRILPHSLGIGLFSQFPLLRRLVLLRLPLLRHSVIPPNLRLILAPHILRRFR